VVELELLLLGITGKLRVWVLLDELVGNESSAEYRRSRVADLQAQAARLL
jgi:hypothetical protein